MPTPPTTALRTALPSRSSRRALGAALAAAPLLMLAACGDASSESNSGEVSVVASAYPFAFLAERIAGDDATVENLVSPGVEPHDVELSGRQVADLRSADVVIYTDGFQEAVDEAVEQADRSSGTVELGKVVGLLEADDAGHTEAGHSEEGHSDEEHSEEGHSHGSTDPHFWQDPNRMIKAAEAIRDALVKADPDNAATYRANTEQLVADLTDLDSAFTTGLATCERRSIVTSHEAFGYLAATYDLQQIPIAGLDPSNEPSPAQLADITDLVKNEGITTIFTEELVSPAIADTVARNTGAKTQVLDPIEGLSDETADQTYLTLMQKNLEAIRAANGCS